MLTNITIDFAKLKSKSKRLDESFVAEWAADIKYVLSHILSPGAVPRLEEQEDEAKEKIVIKGKKEELDAFSDTMGKEKAYALEYLESGIASPKLADIKLDLEKSIHNFEKTTGLIWPLR